jgi:hypothetical protein
VGSLSGDQTSRYSQRGSVRERGGEESLAQTAANESLTDLRLPTLGRRRAANTPARLRTTTLPAQAFARYTATFRPTPVADGKTTLSLPSEIQTTANSCEYPLPPKQSRTTLASSGGIVEAIKHSCSFRLRVRYEFQATSAGLSVEGSCPSIIPPPSMTGPSLPG